jgi:hypothetical protein
MLPPPTSKSANRLLQANGSSIPPVYSSSREKKILTGRQSGNQANSWMMSIFLSAVEANKKGASHLTCPFA